MTDKDPEAPKSNVQNNETCTTEQGHLIDDDDDELLSSCISNYEENTLFKRTSSSTNIGKSDKDGSEHTENVCCNSVSPSTSCESGNSGSANPSVTNRSSSNALTAYTCRSTGEKSRSKDKASIQDCVSPTKVDNAGPSGDTACSNDTNKSDPLVRNDPKVLLADQVDETATPLEMFRPGYLWVSDLTKQHWCEQQLLYSFTVPGIVVEDPVMTKGSDLHLQRELAVHDVVHVDITSSEDIWAVKMLNLLNSVKAFLNGSPLAREVPIFGAPFQEDVFIVGLIDELRFDLETYAIGLSELKTRLSRTKPSKSQEKQHRLQVMLYKKLFDDLVKGNVTKDAISRHLRLTLTKELGESVQEELNKSGLSCKTLDTLLDMVFGRMAAITCIGETSVEYVHQESGQSFLHQDVVYNEDELRNMYRHYLEFWRGQRTVKGVDIEEAWKCQRCDYEAVCEWRQKKASECAKNNKFGRR